MPSESQKLSSALREARRVASHDVLRTAELPRQVREYLQHAGWLHEIIKGYAALVKPNARDNESTVWQANYWNFMAAYLRERFAESYVLSAESSLDLLTGNNVLPRQVIVYSTTGGQGYISLPQGYSIFVSKVSKDRMPHEVASENDIATFSLESAIVRLSPSFFKKSFDTAKVALLLADVSKLARAIVVEEQGETVASRIFEKLQEVGRVDDAVQFAELLKAAGFPIVRKIVPPEFPSASARIRSPYEGRINELWKDMRQAVVEAFPKSQGLQGSPEQVISRIQETYVHDAYHSLSIEGYRVSEELIEKIARGEWNPDSVPDMEHIAAMAAKGYYDAFQQVTSDIGASLRGGNPAEVFERNVQTWYAALFSPSVQSGLLSRADLFGYRNCPVYIRNSQHVPPPRHAVPDAMEALFKCLAEENDPAVRALLGHFTFTYIHPYTDGNGRIGRFLMNFMLVTGGYPWTIIRSDPERLHAYLRALESASVSRDIAPFVKMVSTEMAVIWTNHDNQEPLAP